MRAVHTGWQGEPGDTRGWLTRTMTGAAKTSHLRNAREAWDSGICNSLIEQLWQVRSAMLEYRRRLVPWLANVDPAHEASAANLAHYLALRRFDLRELQERLAWIGVSSLGRAETHVLANLDKVLGILHRLVGRPWTPRTQDEPVGFQRGPALLQRHAQALFGTAPPDRRVRIMVTLPSEAATDVQLVDELVRAGMDIARINCAHDDANAWVAMAGHVRRAARSAGRSVRILMDLAGPKMRTGPIAAEPAAIKLKPVRDPLGVVTQPVRLGLRPVGSRAPIEGASMTFEANAAWLNRINPGDTIKLTDSRLAKRLLTVLKRRGSTVLLECAHTLYLINGIKLRLYRNGRPNKAATLLGVPRPQSRLRLERRDVLRVIGRGLGHAGRRTNAGKEAKATISCTLPQALRQVRKGEHIWFDDGRIGGVIRRTAPAWVEVTITEARTGGEFLAADKGINLPDTKLDLPALCAPDIEDLEVVARHADIVGLSFAQSAEDVHALRAHLHRLGADNLGLILKIETRRGFENLPQLLFAAMGCSSAGVMIARGDLAVECGFERLAEVQEEILWACEAAHVPVVWATQVLESLAKTGFASRAEITDAAMGERAECVMLNKGPHVLEAVRALDDILRRMQTHQSKKRPLLRALKAWAPPQIAANILRSRRSVPSTRPERGSTPKASTRVPKPHHAPVYFND
jgi:pyruvate kinase